ncbi:unnamed protein product [Boreogadus saida]
MQQDADWLLDAGVPIVILLEQICCSSTDHSAGCVVLPSCTIQLNPQRSNHLHVGERATGKNATNTRETTRH